MSDREKILEENHSFQRRENRFNYYPLEKKVSLSLWIV